MIDWKPTYYDNVKDALYEFWHLVELLRSENGCPWDREQTLKSTITSLLSETYELIDAVTLDDKENESEELGDVLLNILLLLKIASDDNNINTVGLINDEIKKIYSRHPHVFGDVNVSSSNEVLKVWSEQKKKEGKTEDCDDFFSRLPKSLSPFERAAELHKKVRNVGFDWDEIDGVYAKVEEELKEVENASNNETVDNLEMECGDLIFASIALCTRLGINPLIAIRRSNEKFERRFNGVVKKANERNIPLDKEHFRQLDTIWDEIKAEEHKTQE